MTEIRMTIAQALTLFETDPQAGYRSAAAVIHEELIRLNKLNQSLTSELAWAWDNLATEEQGIDVLGEASEIDTCVVCRRPTYKHKSTCQLQERKRVALKLTKGESSGDIQKT